MAMLDVHNRVIVHIDVDCFYAQVEMIKNNLPLDEPLGVQQKNIVVTCNYAARKFGVGKCMFVGEALKRCPALRLIRGEDLTDYRNVSYQITGILQSFAPLFERLGLDENFVDVSSTVEKKITEETTQSDESCEIIGNVYEGLHSKDDCCDCGCHKRLAVGSCLAQEMRDAILKELKLTCCAGIAHNKLLAKLVGSSHKPNQQTLLLPESANSLLLSLKDVRSIPGIGEATAEKLANAGVVNIDELRNCESMQIEILGKEVALHLKQLSFGIDYSPVVSTGKQQSLGLEDSFQKCTAVSDCKHRLGELVLKLLERIREDKRIPRTLRLTIRRKTENPSNAIRESRQCSLPFDVANISDDTTVGFQTKIVHLLLNLLTKLIGQDETFCLTLLGVCFSNFTEPIKPYNQIKSYFTHSASTSGTFEENIPVSINSKRKHVETNTKITKFLHMQKRNRIEIPLSLNNCKDADKTGNDFIPQNIDKEIFADLPQEIKDELLHSWKSACTSSSANATDNMKLVSANSRRIALCGKKLPSDIDVNVLDELPLDIQNEILADCLQKAKQDVCQRRKSTILNYLKKNESL